MAETGSHRELLEQNGIYAELWNGKQKITFATEYLTLLPRPEANICQTAQESSLAEDTIDEGEDAAEKK